MGKVEIQIIDQTNDVHGILEPFVNTDFPLVLTNQIYDVNDLGRGKASYSKDFEIPATESNNELLGFMYNANSLDDNDYKGEKDIRLIVNGIQYNNYNKIRITGANLKNGSPHSYKAKIYGSNYEFASEFADIMLSDLDYHWMDGTVDSTTFTHSKTNVVNSFSTVYNDGWDFWFPLINTGKRSWYQGIHVRDFTPLVYAKAILSRAATSIGWTWDSYWLDNTANKLLCLFDTTNRRWTDATIENYLVDVKRSSNYTFNTTQKNYVVFNSETSDASNAYTNSGNSLTTASGKFTCQKTGIYKISGILVVDTDIYNANGGEEWQLYAIHYPASGTPYTSNVLYLKDNGGVSNTSAASKIVIPSDAAISRKFEFEISLKTGDIINLCTFVSGYASLTYEVTTDSFMKIELLPDIEENSEYELKYFMPQDISVRDILIWLSNMYNLRFDADVQKKKIYCEERDNFYDSTSNAVNWSSKIDVRSIKMDFVTNYGRSFKYSYTPDEKDVFITQYNKENELPYGGLTVEMPSKAQFKETTIQTGFSASVAYNDHSLTSSFKQAPYIPFIWDEFFDPTGNKQPEPIKRHNPKILYQVAYNLQATGLGDFSSWELFSFQDYLTNGTVTTTNFTDVPLALFCDPVNGSGVNLSYSDETIAGDGLFKSYHDNEFQMVRDGVIMTAMLNLTDADICNLDLKIPRYFDLPEIKGYWIINKVSDFNPLSTGLTQVEFYKLESTNPITTTTVTYDPNKKYAATNFVAPINKGQQGSTAYNKGYKAGAAGVDLGEGNQMAGNGIAAGNYLNLLEGQIGTGQYNSPIPGASFILGAGTPTVTKTAMYVSESGTLNLTKPSFGETIVDGGADTVRSVAGRSGEPIIDGGLNEVRFIGATSYEQILDGGQD